MKGNTPFRILLVEDNLDDVEITRRALRAAPMAVELHVARDGQEALDFLLRQDGYGPDTPRPDLILLDLNMPRLNGFQVLQKVKGTEALVAIPVIVLTTSAREEDIVNSYKLNANTYVRKPEEFDRFTHILETLEEYWFVIANLAPTEASRDKEAPMLDNESPDELQVLIIEDNDDDVVHVKRVLSRSTVSCRFHVARDGQEALDFLFNRRKLGDAPWPDLVLLDLRLPILEGHEILSRIRGDPDLSSVPVYILTGSKRGQDLDRSLELGADGFLPKPFAIEDVKYVLASVMKRWARQKRGAA